MSDFTCTQKGLEQPLTVGQIFEFDCQGNVPLTFKVDQAQAVGLEDKYSLKVLKFEVKSPQTAHIQFTTYRVGPHKFDKIVIGDGQSTLEFPGANFEVKSVLPPTENGAQPPKPFGPFGPMVIPTPWVYWVILSAVIGIALLLLAWGWKKRRDRREILKQVKNRTTGPTPIVQFHRDLRIWTKKAGVQDPQDQILIPPQIYLKELRMIAETFWGQKFNLALLGQNSGTLEKEFKSHAPKVFVKYKDEIKFWNKRWQRLNATTGQAKMQDFIDITLETRNLIEKMVEEEF